MAKVTIQRVIDVAMPGGGAWIDNMVFEDAAVFMGEEWISVTEGDKTTYVPTELVVLVTEGGE